ncbi:MAG TPA: DUF1289 domain-containing protein [Azonexus sp.]|jgi:predicted Fe-S protein YdhL (DUF1289 family)|nr:DUF1289 domain-containing protein [Azonexus sp.]
MIPSPCRALCQMDPVAKLCRGCLRTIEEITLWSQLSDTERTTVLHNIDERRLDYDPSDAEPTINTPQNG